MLLVVLNGSYGGSGPRTNGISCHIHHHHLRLVVLAPRPPTLLQRVRHLHIAKRQVELSPVSINSGILVTKVMFYSGCGLIGDGFSIFDIPQVVLAKLHKILHPQIPLTFGHSLWIY